MARTSATFDNNALTGALPTATAVYLSLHSGDPGTTGANELSGGGYARQSFNPTTASGGSTSNTGALTCPNAGTTAVTYVGVWTASTAGTFLIGAALASSVTAASITFAANAVTFSLS